MVFEYCALQHIRDEYSALFAGYRTMRFSMNQADLRFTLSLNAWTAITWWALCSDPLVGQRYWIVLVYELTLSRWCMLESLCHP